MYYIIITDRHFLLDDKDLLQWLLVYCNHVVINYISLFIFFFLLISYTYFCIRNRLILSVTCKHSRTEWSHTILGIFICILTTQSIKSWWNLNEWFNRFFSLKVSTLKLRKKLLMMILLQIVKLFSYNKLYELFSKSIANNEF